jgi:O-antigen/teichoic acid export membrane protein
MNTVGIFDAADRIRQTSVMIVPIVTLSILPALSRMVLVDRENATALVETALKLVQVMMLPFVFFIAISADQIIPLLYGAGYEAAIPVLRVVVWAQVFFAMEAVLSQLLIASNHEAVMVRFTAITLGFNIILLFVLVPYFSVIAAAWIILAVQALNLILDIQFISRRITSLRLIVTISKPLLCAAISGGLALIAHNYGLWIALAVYGSTYVILLWLFKVFTANELQLAHHLTLQLWEKLAALKEQL